MNRESAIGRVAEHIPALACAKNYHFCSSGEMLKNYDNSLVGLRIACGGEFPVVICVAFGARWSGPVTVISRMKVKKIYGPAQAIRHMRETFVDQASPAYSKAMALCFASIRREVDIDIARAFFLTACEDQKLRAGL